MQKIIKKIAVAKIQIYLLHFSECLEIDLSKQATLERGRQF